MLFTEHIVMNYKSINLDNSILFLNAVVFDKS